MGNITEGSVSLSRSPKPHFMYRRQLIMEPWFFKKNIYLKGFPVCVCASGINNCIYSHPVCNENQLSSQVPPPQAKDRLIKLANKTVNHWEVAQMAFGLSSRMTSIRQHRGRWTIVSHMHLCWDWGHGAFFHWSLEGLPGWLACIQLAEWSRNWEPKLSSQTAMGLNYRMAADYIVIWAFCIASASLRPFICN